MRTADSGDPRPADGVDYAVMSDFWAVFITIAAFALLALIARGAEKL